MFNEKLIQTVTVKRSDKNFVVTIYYAEHHEETAVLMLAPDVNPITSAALDYLEALRVDSRCNCSDLPYNEEVQRVINTLKSYCPEQGVVKLSKWSQNKVNKLEAIHD